MGEPLFPEEIPVWVSEAADLGEELALALHAEAECMGGELDAMLAARDARIEVSRRFGEAVGGLLDTPDWQSGAPEREAERLAAAMRDIRQMASAVETACLAERAAHEVMVSHARNVLKVEGGGQVYGPTAVARRAPDDPVSLSINGRF